MQQRQIREETVITVDVLNTWQNIAGIEEQEAELEKKEDQNTEEIRMMKNGE